MALPRVDYRNAWSNLDELDSVLLLTWNPDPKRYRHCHETHDDIVSLNYDHVWYWMTSLLCKILPRSCRNYSIMYEISDAGKPHCHGFVVIKDSIKFNKSTIPTLRSNGFIKVNKATSLKWDTFKYHCKDCDHTNEYLQDSRDCICLTPDTHYDMCMHNGLKTHKIAITAEIARNTYKPFDEYSHVTNGYMVNLDPDICDNCGYVLNIDN